MVLFKKGVLKILAKTGLVEPDYIINLAARIRREKQRYVDMEAEQLKFCGVSKNGIKLVSEVCGVNVERWWVVRVAASEARKNGLKPDDLIKITLLFAGINRKDGLLLGEMMSTTSNWKSANEENGNIIIAIPALAEEFGDDLPAFKLIIQDIKTRRKLKEWRAGKKKQQQPRIWKRCRSYQGSRRSFM